MSGVTSSQIAYDQVYQCFCCYIVSFVGGAALGKPRPIRTSSRLGRVT